MTGRPRLFFDASVLVAASGSATGAFALTLEVCRHRAARAVASRLVLVEAERNVRAKLDEAALLRFYRLVADIEFELVQPPAPVEVAVQARIITPKDAHVLAAALKAAVDFLLTLDRRDFMTPAVRQAGLPFNIMTPGEFLRRWVA